MVIIPVNHLRRWLPPLNTSMLISGSGSGSSNVSSLQQIVKQTSVASSSSPKTSSSSYYFSSLPRGLGGYNSLGRPATLPRQPLTQISPDGYSTTDHKRNSDSVMFQRLFQPLPSCDSAIHSGMYAAPEVCDDSLSVPLLLLSKVVKMVWAYQVGLYIVGSSLLYLSSPSRTLL